MDSSTLKRSHIRRIFKRHRGAASQLARELKITRVTVCQWMKGGTVSAKIAEAAKKRARELLAQERAKC